MILVDFSQVIISNFFTFQGQVENYGDDISFLRHLVLNSLRTYRNKFKSQYGELVICCDSNGNYWRKDLFKYYKSNRKKNRDNSDVDWKCMFEQLGVIQDELRDIFPYKLIKIDRVEADDIIYTIVKNVNEKHIIISSDKDFIQLHVNPNIKQYSPQSKKMVSHNNPNEYIIEHIIKGDAGDGIPNIYMDDDFFVNKKDGDKQKSITSKKLKSWMTDSPENFCDASMYKNYIRNENLIKLSKIPNDIQDKIIKEYNEYEIPNRSKIFNYFISKKLSILIENINEF